MYLSPGKTDRLVHEMDTRHAEEVKRKQRGYKGIGMHGGTGEKHVHAIYSWLKIDARFKGISKKLQSV